MRGRGQLGNERNGPSATWYYQVWWHQLPCAHTYRHRVWPGTQAWLMFAVCRTCTVSWQWSSRGPSSSCRSAASTSRSTARLNCSSKQGEHGSQCIYHAWLSQACWVGQLPGCWPCVVTDVHCVGALRLMQLPCLLHKCG